MSADSDLSHLRSHVGKDARTTYNEGSFPQKIFFLDAGEILSSPGRYDLVSHHENYILEP